MPFGGIPVVYDGGDAVQIVASVAERTGMAATDLVATPLADLLDAGALTSGDAELRPCAGEATALPAVEAELARAEAAFASRDKAAALDALEVAFTAMGCLAEVVTPRPAASGFLLRAALHAEQGDEEGARSDVRTALAFDPDAAWPGGGMLDGEALLAAERGVRASASLTLSPAAGPAGPWIDGRALPPGASSVALSPGVHLAQHDVSGTVHSAWVLIGGDARLVLPSTERGVLDRMADPQTRPEIEQLVLAGLPGASTVYVVSGDGLWLVTTDEQGVLTIELGRPAEPPRDSSPIRIRGRGKDKRR